MHPTVLSLPLCNAMTGPCLVYHCSSERLPSRMVPSCAPPKTWSWHVPHNQDQPGLLKTKHEISQHSERENVLRDCLQLSLSKRDSSEHDRNTMTWRSKVAVLDLAKRYVKRLNLLSQVYKNKAFAPGGLVKLKTNCFDPAIKPGIKLLHT